MSNSLFHGHLSVGASREVNYWLADMCFLKTVMVFLQVTVLHCIAARTRRGRGRGRGRAAGRAHVGRRSSRWRLCCTHA